MGVEFFEVVVGGFRSFHVLVTTDSDRHLNNIMLLLTLLDSLDGIPCFEAPG